MEDQQPCLTTESLTMTEVLSTTEVSTTKSSTKSITGTTAEPTTEATTIAVIETCDELDAEWTCSSGTGSVINLESEVSAHLFINHTLIF